MKKILKVTFATLALSALAVTFFIDFDSETERLPASVPDNYESLTACEKQNVLWEKIKSTTHSTLPEFNEMNAKQLFKFWFQKIQYKKNHVSDIAPPRWVKYLHARGSVAKVKIESKNSKYTGIFQGADCGLLRLSLTYKVVGERPVAPGLALKILRDAQPSANISALVSLAGQKLDFNFFALSQSNIVQISSETGQKIVRKLFKRETDYPEELLAQDLGAMDSKGQKIIQVIAPRQIFFVPGPTLQFSSQEHDVREDFHIIPAGTVIYSLYAVPEEFKNNDYSSYTHDDTNELLNKYEHVADIVSTSEFISSEFGDSQLFFKHQLRPKK